jgi:radical SAM protein with 4Fe4S-binding SPASM domain
MARRLSKLGPASVQVSIEGTESTHNRIRGTDNLRRTTEAVRNLVGEGIPASISFTAHRLNYREFPEVARLGRKLHALRVWSDRLIPMGRGCDFETLTSEETREFFGLMRMARREAESAWFGRTKISMVRGLQFLAGGRPYRCKAGDGLLTILPNGDLCPCRRMPVHIGNVTETPLSKLYFESEILKTLRDRTRVSEGCEACRFERQCRGGLRCLSYALHGTPFRADPGCWLAKQPAAAVAAAPGTVLLNCGT